MKGKDSRAAKTDWKSFTDEDLRAVIRDGRVAAERELALRHRLSDGTRLRVSPCEVEVEVNTSNGPRWAEVATFDEACAVLRYLANDVADGQTVNEDVELPDGNDLRVRDGVIEVRVRESWAQGQWVQIASDEESAEDLAEWAAWAAWAATENTGAPEPAVGLVEGAIVAGTIAGVMVAGPIGAVAGGLLGWLVADSDPDEQPDVGSDATAHGRARKERGLR